MRFAHPAAVRRASVALLAVIVAWFASVSQAQTVLDMNTNPATLGWTVQNSSGSHTNIAGALTINSPAFYQFKAPASAWQDVVSSSTPWSVEARLHLGSAVDEQPFTETLMLWIHDNTQLTRLQIFSNGVKLAGTAAANVPYFMDTTNGFHTYRVEGDGMDRRLFVDGSLVISTTANLPGGTPGFFFGDGAGSTASVSTWDYVIINPIPEPAGFAAIAGAALILRRRSRRAA